MRSCAGDTTRLDWDRITLYDAPENPLVTLMTFRAFRRGDVPPGYPDDQDLRRGLPGRRLDPQPVRPRRPPVRRLSAGNEATRTGVTTTAFPSTGSGTPGRWTCCARSPSAGQNPPKTGRQSGHCSDCLLGLPLCTALLRFRAQALPGQGLRRHGAR